MLPTDPLVYRLVDAIRRISLHADEPEKVRELCEAANELYMKKLDEMPVPMTIPLGVDETGPFDHWLE
jgi:hypothetical protein